MRDGIVYFVALVVFLCVAVIVADVFEVAGDLDRHPEFRWALTVAYSIIILSFLSLMGVIVWRGLRGQRTRK